MTCFHILNMCNDFFIATTHEDEIKAVGPIWILEIRSVQSTFWFVDYSVEVKKKNFVEAKNHFFSFHQ